MTDQLKSIFKQVQLPEDAYEEVTQSLKADEQTATKAIDNKLAYINAEIKKYELKLERNYDMYLEGGIDRELYQRKNDDMTAKRQAIEKTRNNIELLPSSNFDSVVTL